MHDVSASVLIVMGVSGSGKTTVGQLLSKAMGKPFYDADDFHPQSNVEKMAAGQPLTDEDRLPWLQTLAEEIGKWDNQQGAVLACSALKEAYRQILASRVEAVNWVFLAGSFDLIKKRIKARTGHFMQSDLLRSQFETLEVPEYGIMVRIEKAPQELTDYILKKIKDNER